MLARLKPSKSSDTTFIYALIDPRTKEIRYIGKADNPTYRCMKHVYESLSAKTLKANWVKSLLKEGKRPVVRIIDEVLRSEWQAAEASYIEFYRSEGCILVNGTPGGEGVGSGEDNHMFGKPMPVEIRTRLSVARKGKKLSAEHRLKMSIAVKGRRLSKETLEKLRLANLGSKNPMFGKQFSKEYRAKMSAALSREKNPFFGKSHSSENRVKMRAGQLRYRQRERRKRNQAEEVLQMTLF